MQEGGPPSGEAGSSLLYNSLKVYLNNKKRVQPFIGLSTVTECVNMDTADTDVMYLCEVCVCRLGITDIRNHIMGSLHRFNYIKAWHPQLVTDWNKKIDLSKLAWPLLELARILEMREGPGHIQVLHLKTELYKEIETCSKDKAISLLNTIRLRWGRKESQSKSEESCSIQSHRIVLTPRMQPVQLKNPTVQSPRVNNQTRKVSVQMSEDPSLMESTMSLSVRVSDWLNETPEVLQLSNKKMPHAFSHHATQSNNNKVLDCDERTPPLIGLSSVVECRGEEDGRLYCFLCHCCRIKSIRDDVIDHLTSSSHYLNYMVENYPGEVDAMSREDIDNSQLLQSVAKKVEQEEGKGRVEVMRLPASLCNQLKGSTYHWCVMTLSNHSNKRSIDISKRKIPAQEPSAVEASVEDPKRRQSTMCKKQRGKAKRKRKNGNVTSPVFKVSLPLSAGSILLKRTSFSQDSLLPKSTKPTPATAARLNSSLPDLLIDGSWLNTSPLTINLGEHTIPVRVTPHPEHSVLREGTDEDSVRKWGRELDDKRYQNAYEPFEDSRCSGQMDNTTGTGKDLQRTVHNWQPADSNRNNRGLRPDVGLMQDWPTYSSWHRGGKFFHERAHQYISDYQSQVGLRDMQRPERWGERSADPAYQQGHRHQPQQQYQEQEHTRPPDAVGCHSPTRNTAYLDVHHSNMGLHGDSVTQERDVAEPRMQLFELGQGLWNHEKVHLYAGYSQTIPPSDKTMTAGYQVFHSGHGGNSDSYSAMNLELHPHSTNNGGRFVPQPQVFISLGQTQTCEAQPIINPNSSLSGMMPGMKDRPPSPCVVSSLTQCTQTATFTGPHFDNISDPPVCPLDQI